MPWTTTEAIEKLKQLCEQGFSASQIAAAFGDRTRNAVIGKLNRMGLTLKGTSRPTIPKPKPAKPKPRFWPKLPHPERPAETQKWAGNPVSFLEAKRGQCREIIDPRGSPEGLAMFCGAPVEEGHVYQFCAYHMAINTYPPRPRGGAVALRPWVRS